MIRCLNPIVENCTVVQLCFLHASQIIFQTEDFVSFKWKSPKNVHRVQQTSTIHVAQETKASEQAPALAAVFGNTFDKAESVKIWIKC